MHQNVVPNGVKHLNPVPVCLVHAGELPRVFQRKAKVRSQIREKLRQDVLAVSQTKHTHQHMIAVADAGDGCVLPAQFGSHGRAQ